MWRGEPSAELHVVYVGKLPNVLMRNDPDILGFNRRLYDVIEHESLEALWKLTWQAKATGATVAGAHHRVGGVAEEIVDLAKDLEADIIVIGSRGYGRVRRVIDGSISDFVVRHAYCPVMIVRMDKKRRAFWRRSFSSDVGRPGRDHRE